MDDPTAHAEALVEDFVKDLGVLKEEIGKVIVGQTEVIDDVLIALLAGGHVLLEGVPGLGKTLLVRTLAEVMDLPYARIQFTPDLMPADITGTNIVVENDRGRRSFSFQKGPIFASIVLADEINRATPKTQSALLEAMQEAAVTVAGERRPLPQPFFVLATQNPIEMEGTYPLPEAQLDRFLFKVRVEYPDRDDLLDIFDRTTGAETATLRHVLDAPRLLELKTLVRDVLVARPVAVHAADLILATHPQKEASPPEVRRYIRFGASPRGGQSILLAAKVRALMHGRFNVSFDDLRRMMKPALRHRIILNFEAEAEGMTPDSILDAILDHVKP
ncbi:MAG TPA: MoxR family ATPase [Planctomycetes bacterium]|nr:MoxR family ATPase [Planctomycetota bacterium]